MTSSRSSKIAPLAIVLTVLVAAVAPAAAVSIASEDVPAEGEVGTTVEATITLDSLYQEPSFQSWELQGSTGLQEVTWIVAFKDPSGSTFAQRQYNGQEFSQPGIDAESGTDPFGSPITEIDITVRGTVPPVEAYDYEERETFEMATLTQQAGSTGSTNEIGSWDTHHFTTADDEGNAGSQEARQAIANAEQAIAEAQADGADTEAANQSLNNAIEFYESGDFNNAVKNARTAKDEADEAHEDVQSSRETTQLLLYLGLAVLIVALIGGGYWYYQEQQDDYDKLG